MSAIPAFIDLAIPDQTLELRSYLKGLGAEISEENTDAGALTDLKAIIEAAGICWKECSDGDIEILFNGIISLLLLVPQDQIAQPISLFCVRVSKSQPGDKKATVRLKLLSNLFYGLPENSNMRADIFLAMLRLAKETEQLSLVTTDLKQIKQWIAHWDISSTKLQLLYRTLHDALTETKTSGDTATKVMIELLGTYTEDDASQARDDAHRCIVTCLGDPNTYLLDHLLTLKPVKFLEGELIHDLLTIFVSGKLSQYQQFYKSNTDFVNSLGLTHEQNIRKMRLLTFVQLAETKKDLDFSVIQKEMQLESDELEDFIIDVLRTKTVRAKIDQIQKKVQVSSTIQRTFGKPQWQVVRQQLLTWRENLDSVMTSLHSLERLQNAANP